MYRKRRSSTGKKSKYLPLHLHSHPKHHHPFPSSQLHSLTKHCPHPKTYHPLKHHPQIPHGPLRPQIPRQLRPPYPLPLHPHPASSPLPPPLRLHRNLPQRRLPITDPLPNQPHSTVPQRHHNHGYLPLRQRHRPLLELHDPHGTCQRRLFRCHGVAGGYGGARYRGSE